MNFIEYKILFGSSLELVVHHPWIRNGKILVKFGGDHGKESFKYLDFHQIFLGKIDILSIKLVLSIL